MLLAPSVHFAKSRTRKEPSISKPPCETSIVLTAQDTNNQPIKVNAFIDADSFQQAEMIRVEGKQTPDPIVAKLYEKHFTKTGHRYGELEGDIFMRNERLWLHRTLWPHKSPHTVPL